MTKRSRYIRRDLPLLVVSLDGIDSWEDARVRRVAELLGLDFSGRVEDVKARVLAEEPGLGQDSESAGRSSQFLTDPVHPWRVTLDLVFKVLAVVVSILAGSLIWLEGKSLNRGIEAQALSSVYVHGAQLMSALDPDLGRKYYAGHSTLSEEDFRDPRLMIVAERQADYFEHVLTHFDTFSRGRPELWRNYMKSEYARSPVLRYWFWERANWYSPELMDAIGDEGLLGRREELLKEVPLDLNTSTDPWR